MQDDQELQDELLAKTRQNLRLRRLALVVFLLNAGAGLAWMLVGRWLADG